MAGDIEIIGIKIDQLLEYNQRQDKRIGEIHQILMGNGEPERGMVVKQARLSERVDNVCKSIKIHWGILIGVILAAIGAVLKVII